MTEPASQPTAATDVPAWKQAYPVKQSQEHATSRRAFAKLIAVSLVAAAGGYLVKDRVFAPQLSGPKRAIATTSELAVGAYKLFQYPEHQPCILIRLAETEYVAYSQSCTHLMCPVHYNATEQKIVCPCHQGFFDPRNGKVLAGPPPRPLPRYKVTVEGDEIIIG